MGARLPVDQISPGPFFPRAANFCHMSQPEFRESRRSVSNREQTENVISWLDAAADFVSAAPYIQKQPVAALQASAAEEDINRKPVTERLEKYASAIKSYLSSPAEEVASLNATKLATTVRSAARETAASSAAVSLAHHASHTVLGPTHHRVYKLSVTKVPRPKKRKAIKKKPSQKVKKSKKKKDAKR